MCPLIRWYVHLGVRASGDQFRFRGHYVPDFESVEEAAAYFTPHFLPMLIAQEGAVEEDAQQRRASAGV